MSDDLFWFLFWQILQDIYGAYLILAGIWAIAYAFVKEFVS